MAGTTTTYSFADVNATIQHPQFGQKSVNGLGIGTITVAYADNLTESELAADGSVMVTKILSARGTVTLEIQQTSSLNKWLLNLANSLVTAATSLWAEATFHMVENFANGVTINASDLALQKRPDHANGQQGATVQWVFFSPNISET